MSDVCTFRLFGRAPEPPPAPPDSDAAGVTWAPGPWSPGPWSTDPGPATRHARPVAFRPAFGGGVGGRFGGGGVDDDPPTDPHGFPPVPPGPGAAPGQPGGPPADPLPDVREAAALAGAFAADYLSWDEDDPGRRGRALAEHLAVPVGEPALLGWDGRGRQRAEFALPGAVRPDGDDRFLVDVRVRVTPYRAVSDGAVGDAVTGGAVTGGAVTDGGAAGGVERDTAGPEPDVPGVPAAAPAPTGRGWRGGASYWIRLSVPVVREDDRLVVDAAEETPAERPAEGHALPGAAAPAEGDLRLPPADDRLAVAESAW